MSCKTKKGYAANPNAVQRRQRVIKRLEAQLKAGTKPSDEGLVQLEEKDINRINKELEVLKSRI